MRITQFRWRKTVDRPDPGAGLAATLVLAGGFGVAVLALVSHLTGWSLSPLTWYLSRASGLMLYVTLWLTVVLGLGMTTHLFDRFINRHMSLSLHQFLTQVSFGFLGLHLASLAADPYVNFTPSDLFVPLHSGLDEPWTAAGILSMYVLILTGLPLAISRFTGYRAWRILHYLTFPLYVMALAHGIGSGTDDANRWVMAFYIATAATVAVLTFRRIFYRRTLAVPQAAPQPSFDRLANQPAAVRRAQGAQIRGSVVTSVAPASQPLTTPKSTANPDYPTWETGRSTPIKS